MPYIARADMAAAYGDGEMDGIAPLDETGASRADQAITRASAEIDAALGAHYDLPLGAVCPLLTDIALPLARERLYDDVAPQRDDVAAPATSARLQLRALADARLILIDINGHIVPRRPLVVSTSPAPRLTREALDV